MLEFVFDKVAGLDLYDTDLLDDLLVPLKSENFWFSNNLRDIKVN